MGDSELKMVGQFGLRGKRELWRVQLKLSQMRKAARTLLTLDEDDPRRMFEGEALLRQRHIRVVKQIVNVPSFLVRTDSQKHIDFSLSSPFGGGRPGRNRRKREAAKRGGGDEEDDE